MGKAMCIKQNIYTLICDIKLGDKVIYEITEDGYFKINGNQDQPLIIHSNDFFWHFRVIEGSEKMDYSAFEYILTNYIFGSAVLFPEEYSGVRHLIIQNWGGYTIMININKDQNAIRVSFPDCQKIYNSYEEAIDGIINHGD